MVALSSPLRSVVGDKTATVLRDQLDLRAVGDLLYHFPRRYLERGQHTDLAALRVGDQVTVLAQVQKVSVRPMRQRRGKLLEVTVGDGHRTVALTFFNQAWRQRDLAVGRWGLFAGKVTEFAGRRQLNGPEYQLLPDPDAALESGEVSEFTGALIPVYPAVRSMPSWTIARCVRVALDMLTEPPDPLPDQLRRARRLIGLGAALRDIHLPDGHPTLGAARRRLAWDEAFAVQLTLVQRKARAADWPAVPRPPRDSGLLAAFDRSLPFRLTDGQRAVGAEIADDLARPHPMHRLLQGEVGSGKTLVALRAMLQVVDAGGQAVLLAPTEVLAAQHHRGLTELLGGLGRGVGAADGMLPLDDADRPVEATRLALLTGSLGAAARRAVLAELAGGAAGIVVGTHALLYEGVQLHDLGLVVVDEQHRFGVEQRDALRDKADQPPHMLVMTATPIPRTVAMTVFGDLSVSSLTELPRGRSPIATHLVPGDRQRWMDRSWARVREEVAAGHQAYVVCPRIGDAESDGDVPDQADGATNDDQRRPPLAVSQVAAALRDGPLAELRVGVLHGRLPAEEKAAVMRTFAAGKLDVLVATTVVEVGVDVPNATMMVIMDADRFGVSQLHQLRGRVGRGSAPGLCLLVSEAEPGSHAHERLSAVASTVDGFRLAELDLEQRREGDVLGDTQSGRRTSLRLLSLLRDADLIAEARVAAVELIDADPRLEKHPRLADEVAALVSEDRAEFLEKG